MFYHFHLESLVSLRYQCVIKNLFNVIGDISNFIVHAKYVSQKALLSSRMLLAGIEVDQGLSLCAMGHAHTADWRLEGYTWTWPCHSLRYPARSETAILTNSAE